MVDVYINYLRRKLGAAGPVGEGKEDLIETVRGAGYRMGGLRTRPLIRAPRTAASLGLALTRPDSAAARSGFSGCLEWSWRLSNRMEAPHTAT